jgi:hypothetical protein
MKTHDCNRRTEMTDHDSQNGFKSYRPSKATWLWSCVGTAVATMIVGFTWGGWMTEGTHEDIVSDATASAEVAAAICVERFLAAENAGVQLATLKEESSWRRDSMIEDAGWATPLGFEEPIEGAADRCADQLAAIELPVAEQDAVTEAALTGEADPVAN